MATKRWSRTQTEHQLRLANIENKIVAIESHIHIKMGDLSEIRYMDGHQAGAEKPEYDDSNWEKFELGQTWGGRDKTCWFRLPFQVPEIPAKQKLSAIILPGKKFDFISSEGGDLREYELLVYLDGGPLQSLDVRRNKIPLWDKVRSGEKHLLAIEAFSGLENHTHVFRQAELVAVRQDVEDFYYNSKLAFEALVLLNETEPCYVALYKILNESLLKINFLLEGQDGFFDSVADANRFLKKGLKDLPQAEKMVNVICIGHSHLDIAWKWQTSHSRKKAARTAANALRQIELYPNFRFMQSQPQLYQYLQENYPDMFEKIKEKVKAGQWEATGGMWVESDCNLPGGESLVRQFLYGKRFFKKEFGTDSKVVWLPDVFGFCYSLPQIIKKSGMEYFTTTKLSWNQFTDFPFDTFWWQGLDGTKILTHMVSTPDRRGWNDYSVDLNPANIKWCWDNYRQKENNEEVLLSFGWGDGGGGPTPDMQEKSNRMFLFPNLPNHRQDFVEKFFAALDKRVKELPVWNDELYLEYHRGCYTSQAQIKRNNRKSEVLLHNAEFLSTLNFLKTGDYPQQDLNKAWELLLLNQFHDILPGSSIPEVYEDSEQEFETIRNFGKSAIENAIEQLAEIQQSGQYDFYYIFNTLGHQRTDVVELTIPEDLESFEIRNKNKSLPYQKVSNNTILVEIKDVPSYGYLVLTLHQTNSKPFFGPDLVATTNKLENDFFRIHVDEKGHFTSIYDKRQNREVIQQGKTGNVLQVFEDRPLSNDAWDIDIFYLDKKTEIDSVDNIEVLEKGPVRVCLLVERTFLKSKITQKIYIYHSIPRIDFETEINWGQHQTLLKVAFPVNVFSSKATYEIPYGSIERPTHWNTISDMAKFEVPAQKWADLSDAGYGVGLLNDCKYGYDIKDSTLRLTLLRSPIDPDPNADIGFHKFCYSLLPHGGDWREGDTAQNAYHLNVPLIAKKVKAENPTADFSFVACNQKNIFVETIKKAEGKNGIVVRLYEAYNKTTTAELLFAYPIEKVFDCNLLEKEQTPIKFNGQKILFTISPFEIKTLMVYFEK
jgi:alpha-mannosidase